MLLLALAGKHLYTLPFKLLSKRAGFSVESCIAASRCARSDRNQPPPALTGTSTFASCMLRVAISKKCEGCLRGVLRHRAQEETGAPVCAAIPPTSLPPPSAAWAQRLAVTLETRGSSR